MEIVDSARKHGVADGDIQWAFDHQLRSKVVEYDGEDQYLGAGPTRTGQIIEFVALPSVGATRIIHAMRITPKVMKILGL